MGKMGKINGKDVKQRINSRVVGRTIAASYIIMDSLSMEEQIMKGE